VFNYKAAKNENTKIRLIGLELVKYLLDL
jgi:hypothetical protein